MVVSLSAVILLTSACAADKSPSEISALKEQVAELEAVVAEANATTLPASSSSAPTTPLTTPRVTQTTIDPTLAILQRSYRWMESSAGVSELQAIVGATPDGVYGERTRARHIAALQERGLSTTNVPVMPSSSSGSTTGGGGGSSVAVPDGGLLFPRCSDCGQGFSSGNCANWKLSITNSSNVTVKSMTFSPPGSTWRDRSAGWENPVEIPADGPGRTFTINLAPYQTMPLQFQICTNTPQPGSTWEYSNLAPITVAFEWVNGAGGSACFRGC
jgi:hypothetical protein